MNVTFGTPVVYDNPTEAFSTSFAMALSGVTSGQPVVAVAFFYTGTSLPSGISDTFATPYTWTMIVESNSNYPASLWIGTGGAGTSGTVTVSGPNGRWGGYCVPCIGASSGAGSAAVDTSASSNGTTSNPSAPTLTTSAAGEGLVCVINIGNPAYSASGPGSPWTSTAVTLGGAEVAVGATYPAAPSGSSSPSWTATIDPTDGWDAVGAAIKAAGGSGPSITGSLSSLTGASGLLETSPVGDA
jgi:hypothetical protein